MSFCIIFVYFIVYCIVHAASVRIKLMMIARLVINSSFCRPGSLND